MKKAKIVLTAVALLAFIGGALAFKASRGLNPFYKYTTTPIGGKVTGICKEEILLNYTYAPGGSIITTYSSAPFTSAVGTTTCTARVNFNL